MKGFLLLLLLLPGLSVTAQKLSLQLRNVEIRKALRAIEQQSEYRFLYNYDLPGLRKQITVDAIDQPVDLVLDQILYGSELTHKRLSSHLIVITLSEQETTGRIITGQITDEDRRPLPGTTLRIKGTNYGLTTDTSHHFRIMVPENGILQFSCIGYANLEIDPGNRRDLQVVMKALPNLLNEVVIIGYGAQRNADLSSAVSGIGLSEMPKRPVVNAVTAIQGKAAGVQVMAPSGKPGAGLHISIRGNASFSLSNDPLYVVDGVPVRNINTLNPADIDHISVLKDAAAAAIYGASGANGVVIITTRVGHADSSVVGLQLSAGVAFFRKKIPLLDRDQYLDLMQELGYADPGRANTDWQDEAFGAGTDHNTHLYFAGGNDNTRYYASMGYRQQKGVVAPSRYDRYNIRLNLDSRVKSWFRINNALNFSKTDYVDVADNANVARGGAILSTLTTPPTIGIWKAEGVYADNPNKAGWENPIANAFAPDQKAVTYRALATLSGELDITRRLRYKPLLGLDAELYRWDFFLDPISTQNGRDQHGIGRATRSSRLVWNLDHVLEYRRRFGRHQATLLGAWVLQESRSDFAHQEGKDYPNGAVPTLNNAGTKVVSVTTATEWARQSFLSRFTYDFGEKYFLQANLRMDASSRFAPQMRSAYFPSVSAAWKISSEPFMNGSPPGYLKLRLGWGLVGNDEGIGDYPYLSRYAPTGLGGYTLVSLENPDLRWETTGQTNLAIDLGIWKNRIEMTVEVYRRSTRNLIVFRELPPSSLFNVYAENLGDVSNKGLEWSFRGRLFQTPSLTWTTDANYSLNRNRITALNHELPLFFGDIYERGAAIKAEVGQPLGAFYGLVARGVDPESGKMQYADLDQNGVINDNDRTYIGYAQPDFTYGWGNRLQWKGLELYILFQGVHGNDIFNASRIDLESMNDSKNQSAEVLRRWQAPGHITDIPGADKGSTDNTRISSRFVEDGSFLRLKNLTLSWQPPALRRNQPRFAKTTIYLSSENLLTFTRYKGLDPEVSQYAPNGPAMGIDFGTYPPARSITLGLNTEF